MVEMLFSLKYQSQIRRIRPELFSYLEKTIINGIVASGGRIRQEYHCIIALFDERSIGFWLDMLTVLDTVQRVTGEASRDLYGHTCVLSSGIDDEMIPALLLSLPKTRINTGIWCALHLKSLIEPFVFFNDNCINKWNLPLTETFTELRSIKKNEDLRKNYPLRKEIGKKLSENGKKNSVLIGRDYIGKRDCLHWYCENINSGFMPLTIRFGSWGASLNCFADAYSPAIRDIILSSGTKIPEELNGLFEILFRERLRSECTVYLIQKCKTFFRLLLEVYIKTALNKKCIPILILESIQNTDAIMRDIFFESYEAQVLYKPVVYGTCSFPEVAEPWKNLFESIIVCSSDNVPVFGNVHFNFSIWEIALACKLFTQYYPSWTLLKLFEEEGKNPIAIKKSFDILLNNGIIRSLDDPEPEILGFLEGVEKLLEDRADYIRNIVKNRLLAWVANGRLSPCFNLLEILYEFGVKPSPLLVLKSVRQDTLIGAFRDIEKALHDKRFNDICGQENAAPIFYIYKTLKSLIYRNEKEIKETFKMEQPLEITLSAYKAQILTINAIHKIGLHDANTAMEEVKEAMIICQSSSERIGIAQVYRLFALVHYYKKDINDAIDYLNFAIEETERSKDYDEMAIVSFYSAAAYFVFGNISKAIRLVKQAEQAAGFSGRQEWALRAVFFLGRLYFEIGRYEDAVKIFKKLRAECTDSHPSQKTMMLDAWIYRTKLYLSQEAPDKPEFLNWDGKLFEIEASYLSGDYQKAIELSDTFTGSLPEESYYFLEQPDWSSGFAQCELLLYSKKDYWFRMITVWRSLAICCLEKNKAHDAVHIMQQIMRDERMADIDPNAAFYFFTNFRVLYETEASEIDRNTAISMAFKRLQRRASRIDDIDIRREFLSEQYWNKVLFSTAKEYKLI